MTLVKYFKTEIIKRTSLWCGVFIINFEKFINHLWWRSFCKNSLQLKACFCCNIVFFQDISTWYQEAAFLRIFLKHFFALREKCSNTEFFLVRIQENTDQKNFVFGHFSRSVEVCNKNLSLKALVQS